MNEKSKVVECRVKHGNLTYGGVKGMKGLESCESEEVAAGLGCNHDIYMCKLRIPPMHLKLLEYIYLCRCNWTLKYLGI